VLLAVAHDCAHAEAINLEGQRRRPAQGATAAVVGASARAAAGALPCPDGSGRRLSCCCLTSLRESLVAV
jgi:hypothetical protein